ncbi:hypothetical protein BD413DRAFT_612062 [Trametes elegans]|nr:hypothetical protein BD413DRAFT_612062 [Trametes elegans]
MKDPDLSYASLLPRDLSKAALLDTVTHVELEVWSFYSTVSGRTSDNLEFTFQPQWDSNDMDDGGWGWTLYFEQAVEDLANLFRKAPQEWACLFDHLRRLENLELILDVSAEPGISVPPPSPSLPLESLSKHIRNGRHASRVRCPRLEKITVRS